MTAMIFAYQAYGQIPLGDASAVINSNSVWTSIIAYVFLKEKIHALDVVAIPLTIVGIIFFSQPSFLFGDATFEKATGLGLCFAVLCSLLAASAFNIIRKIGKDVHFTVTVFFYSILGTVIIGMLVLLSSGFNYPCSVSTFISMFVAIFRMIN